MIKYITGKNKHNYKAELDGNGRRKGTDKGNVMQ